MKDAQYHQRHLIHQNGSVQGSVMVEFAIMIPLLLLMLFGLLFVGHLYAARAAVSTAVNSVRMAATRANLTDTSTIQIMTDIQDFKNGINVPRLKKLLASPDLQATALDPSTGEYSVLLTSIFGGSANLEDLSDGYLLSMIYAINIIRENLGQDIRTPCQEEGCVLCLPVPNPSDPTNMTPLNNFTAIQCEYHPDTLFLKTVRQLLSIITPSSLNVPSVTITKEQSISLG